MEWLKNRFKKRDVNKQTQQMRYVPQRLKVSAHGDGSHAQMCGYLKKKQKNNVKWKKMWFLLKENVLYMYKASEDSVATDTIPILGYILETHQKVGF